VGVCLLLGELFGALFSFDATLAQGLGHSFSLSVVPSSLAGAAQGHSGVQQQQLCHCSAAVAHRFYTSTALSPSHLFSHVTARTLGTCCINLINNTHSVAWSERLSLCVVDSLAANLASLFFSFLFCFALHSQQQSTTYTLKQILVCVMIVV
jgi:hypothetical protein